MEQHLEGVLTEIDWPRETQVSFEIEDNGAKVVTSHHNPATGFRRNPASGWGADEHLARVQGWLGLGAGATERDFGEVGAIFGAR